MTRVDIVLIDQTPDSLECGKWWTSCLRCAHRNGATNDRSAHSYPLIAPFPTERQQGILRQWTLPKSERLAGGTIWSRRAGRLVSARPRHLTTIVTRLIYVSFLYRAWACPMFATTQRIGISLM
jgi:hypothetical protein